MDQEPLRAVEHSKVIDRWLAVAGCVIFSGVLFLMWAALPY
jgi:hypothetical protein